jgi:hypothetical protein
MKLSIGQKIIHDLEDETKAAEIGKEIAEILNLRSRQEPEWTSPRYYTAGGTKSACGLARTVARAFGL